MSNAFKQARIWERRPIVRKGPVVPFYGTPEYEQLVELLLGILTDTPMLTAREVKDKVRELLGDAYSEHRTATALESREIEPVGVSLVRYRIREGEFKFKPMQVDTVKQKEYRDYVRSREAVVPYGAMRGNYGV